MKAFAVGDRVHVPRLGTGIVREVRNGGRYVIEIKGRTMVVQASQIEDAGAERRPGKHGARDSMGTDLISSTSGSSSLALDLHGKTVIESLDALDIFLNDAILDAHAEVRVIHGRSGGRVKAAVHKRLQELTTVRAFRIDPRNPGVTIVFF